MKRLVILNVISTLILFVSSAIYIKFVNPYAFLVFMATAFGLLALSIINIAAPIMFWKQHRRRGFFPPISWVTCMAMFLLMTWVTRPLLLRGSPADPDSYLTEETRLVLGRVGDELLGHGFKRIRTFKSQPVGVTFVQGEKSRALPTEIVETLRRLRIDETSVDDAQNLVVFGHYHIRTWYEYIYCKSELLPLYSRPAEITEVDIELWSELIKIARQGPDATTDERRRLVFRPRIAYPFLESELGSERLHRIAAYESERQLSGEDMENVLAALNRLRLPASKLVEHAEIWFEPVGELGPSIGIEESGATSGFWVTELVEQLVDRGTLTYADDGRHLRIKEGYSATEALEIEWVHVGLINFIFGNLVWKDDHAYERSLGNGWYFNVD